MLFCSQRIAGTKSEFPFGEDGNVFNESLQLITISYISSVQKQTKKINSIYLYSKQLQDATAKGYQKEKK